MPIINISSFQDLVDIDIFREAKKVIDALKNREVASALTWCADNKTRLKKSKVCGDHGLCTLIVKIYFHLFMNSTQYLGFV